MSSVRYRPTQKSASPMSAGGLEGGWGCHEARVSLPVATVGCAHWFEVRNLEIIVCPPPPNAQNTEGDTNAQMDMYTPRRPET